MRTSYYQDGNIASLTDALGKVTTYSYNAFDEVSQITHPVNDRTMTGTDPSQSISTLRETYTYDRRGLQTNSTATGSYTDLAGINISSVLSSAQMQYDAFGRVIKAIDGNNHDKSYIYDRLGRVVQTIINLTPTTPNTNPKYSATYDASNRVLTETDPNNNVTRYQYNNALRTITVTTPEGIINTTKHNRHGEVESIVDGLNNFTTYLYDANGNLLQTTTSLAQTNNRYDAGDRLIEMTDARGIKTQLVYDQADRIIKRTVDPSSTGYVGLNLITTYQYDALGQQVSVTDPNGVITTIEFDRNGQVKRHIIDPAWTESHHRIQL